jgi:acetyl-CoA carboxylase carboxyltransferase component
MGLEGSVKLGQRKELLAVEDLVERKELYEKLVASTYAAGKALKYAEMFEVDDVIDPADTRFWITRSLESCPPTTGWQHREHKKRYVDTW